jgi:hypothetical protein
LAATQFRAPLRRKTMRRTLILIGLSLAALPLVAQTPPDGKAAFARLKSLVGDWQGRVETPSGPPAQVEFRLTGNGSALVERLFPGTEHEMLTVYHMDGAELVLTHYCAMANQPRMKLVEGGAEGELRFEFAGGDNVDPKTSLHMHAGRVVLDKDSYESEWTVFSSGASAGSKRFFMRRDKTQ